MRNNPNCSVFDFMSDLIDHSKKQTKKMSSGPSRGLALMFNVFFSENIGEKILRILFIFLTVEKSVLLLLFASKCKVVTKLIVWGDIPH